MYEKNDPLNSILVPDIDDIYGLSNRFGWLILFYDHIVMPQFGSNFNDSMSCKYYGILRDRLEEGWSAYYKSPYDHKNLKKDLNILISEEILQINKVEPLQHQNELNILDNIYDKMLSWKGLDEVPGYDKWKDIIKYHAHTIGQATFKLEGDVLFAGIEAERCDIKQQYLIRKMANATNLPIASSHSSQFIIPSDIITESKNVEMEITNMVYTITSNLPYVFPSFKEIGFDELLNIKYKYNDLLIPARRHLRRLSYTFAKELRTIDRKEAEKWVEYYVRDVIVPDVEAFREAISKDRSKIARKIITSIIGFCSSIFGATGWENIAVSALKESFGFVNSLDSKNEDKLSFIKLLSKFSG